MTVRRAILYICTALLLGGCSGPWGDLAARYVDKSPSALSRNDATVVLEGTNHKATFSVNDLASYQIDKSGIRMAVREPLSWLLPPIRIPVKAVTACSRISWSSGFDTPLWIGDAKVEIVLKGYEQETLQWCKAMSIPVVSRDLEWKWLRSSRQGMPSNSTAEADTRRSSARGSP